MTQECKHIFLFSRQVVHSGGVAARCPKCRRTFTAWPNTLHYDEIIAARDKDVREEYAIAVVALERIVTAERRGEMKSIASNALQALAARKAPLGKINAQEQRPPWATSPTARPA